MLVDPTLKISVNGKEMAVQSKVITEKNRVDDIIKKFKSKWRRGSKKVLYKI
jgi:hypothetical protein